MQLIDLRRISVAVRRVGSIHPDSHPLGIFKALTCVCSILCCLIISHQVYIAIHTNRHKRLSIYTVSVCFATLVTASEINFRAPLALSLIIVNES